MAALVDWRQGEQAKIVLPAVGEILIPKGTQVTIMEPRQEDKKVTVQKPTILNTTSTYFCTFEGSNNDLIAIQDNYYISKQKNISSICFATVNGLYFHVY